MCEVGRRRELRLAREQARAADGLDPLAEQAAPARVRWRMLVRVNAGIDVLAAEVRRLMRRRDLDVEVAVQRVELREARNEPPDRERRRNLEPQRLPIGFLLQLPGRIFELVERLSDGSRIGDSLRRQSDASPVAHEKLHAEPRLERRNVAAYRALRDAEFRRRLRKARVPRRGFECAHRIQRRKTPGHVP